MKEVMAVIRINMMNVTKAALSEAGISSFTAREAVGRGKGIAEEKGRLVPKRILFIVVPNKLVKRTVGTIIKTNKTGKPGDGKIFVTPVLDSIRIRTGEEGEVTLDEE